MDFMIDQSNKLTVSDEEIYDLLSQVYVTAGYTTAEIAEDIFNPLKVRARGTLFVSRDVLSDKFSGMVIIVPPESEAIFRAKRGECEVHLLAVIPAYRRQGLGRKLVMKAITYAQSQTWTKMILWTQKSMKEAQALYESLGFIYREEITKNCIDFLVYEKDLMTQ